MCGKKVGNSMNGKIGDGSQNWKIGDGNKMGNKPGKLEMGNNTGKLEMGYKAEKLEMGVRFQKSLTNRGTPILRIETLAFCLPECKKPHSLLGQGGFFRTWSENHPLGTV